MVYLAFEPGLKIIVFVFHSKLISWGLLNSFLFGGVWGLLLKLKATYEKDSSFPKKIFIQIALQCVKSEMPKEPSLWKPYKYIQRWWVPYGSNKWNPLLWISSSSLKQNTIGWIWCSWNKALIAWPNNTLNPLPSRHFKLCQIGFGMWTNILEPDSHMHSSTPWK